MRSPRCKRHRKNHLVRGALVGWTSPAYSFIESVSSERGMCEHGPQTMSAMRRFWRAAASLTKGWGSGTIYMEMLKDEAPD